MPLLLRLCPQKQVRNTGGYFNSVLGSPVVARPALHRRFWRSPATIGRGRGSKQSRLKAVAALDDEWLAERRASWLIDCGNSQAASDLLRGTRFQLVHQRYERTRLWRQVETSLGLEPVEYPSWLGEDDLAEFGAYRDQP